MSQSLARPDSPHHCDLSQTIARHEGLLQWVVRHQWLGDLPFAEALHIGRIALWRAIQGYDPTRGIAFSTYAVPAIRRALWRAVAQARPNPAVLLTPSPPQETPDPQAEAEEAIISETLHALVATLPFPLDFVIRARYGLDGNPQTFAAIGRALGVTRQRAQQLHVQALLWLAHPAHSLPLRQLLDLNSRADYQAYLARLRRWLRARRRSPNHSWRKKR